MLTKHREEIPSQVDGDTVGYCTPSESNKSMQVDTNSDLSASKEKHEKVKIIVDQPTLTTKKCPVCHRGFTVDGHLYVHLLTKHRPKILTALVCDICGKSYASRKNLRQHQIFCGKPRKGPICEYCGRQCLTNTHLKRHLYVHTGTPEFLCEICYKKFATQRSLNNHMLLHTGYRPFQCKACRKPFSQASALKNHKCGHGRRTQECNKCGGVFCSNKMLKKHICLSKKQ